MRLLLKCFHWKTQNANELIKCSQNDLEIGVSSVVINITISFQKC